MQGAAYQDGAGLESLNAQEHAMYGYSRIRHYSSGSSGSDKDYGYAHSEEVLQAIRQVHGTHCVRCEQKVYPTEKVEVGIQLHKKCFRCRECNVVLTLNTFILAKLDESGRKDVFCKVHSPVASKNVDQDSMAIKNLVRSQQMINKRPSFNTQIRLADMAGWEYDPKAIEFEHAKVISERNRLRRPRGHDLEPDDIDYEKGDVIRKLRQGDIRKEKVKDLATTMADVIGKKYNGYDENGEPIRQQDASERHMRKVKDVRGGRKFPTNTDYMEPNALWSPAAPEDPWHPSYLDQRGGMGGHHGDIGCEPIYSNSLIISRSATNPTFQDIPRSRDQIYGNPRQGALGERIYETLGNPRAAPVVDDMVLGSRAGIQENGFGHRPHGGQDAPNYFDRNRRAYRSDNMLQWGRESKTYEKPAYENFAHMSAAAKQAAQGAAGSGVGGGGRGQRGPGAPNHRASRAFMTETKFVAQNELELRQRHEHDEMIRDLEKVRESQIQRLEGEVKRQLEAAVGELFVQMDTGTFQGDLDVEKMKIEERFQRLKGEKMRRVMSNLSEQERIRIDDMIDKQTQEMLQLIDQKVPVRMPSPRPPKKKKQQVYDGPHVFDDVDFHAVQVAQVEQESFTELVYELTRHCKSSLEKARAIFKWITFKDLNKMMFDEELTEESPYYFLKGIKYGLESYHELFKRLCSYAGLPVNIVRGLSKSAGYRPGMPFGDSRFKNSWVVVHIDDTWRFVDCHWGARHVSKPDDVEEPSNFCYELDEFFFLTDPEDMIYMHLPDDPQWQMLPEPVTLEQFVALPVVKSHFYHYGLKIKSEESSVLETDTGQVEVILKLSNKIKLAFNSRLESDGEELEGYCVHHYQGKEVIFNLGLPRKGVFYLTLFASDKDKAASYNNVCAFRIRCSHVTNKPFCKLPRLADGYGPTPLASELGLTAEKVSEYYLVCQDEKMILTFKFRCPVRVSQKLSGSGQDGQDLPESLLDRLVFQRYKDHGLVSYLLRFPARGIYVLSIFAGFRDSGSQSLECACRYLIQCNKRGGGEPPRPYPKTLQYWHKCRLHEPTCGDLKVNKNVKFKVEVQDADALAVIVGQQWVYLKKDEGGKVWEGVANTGKDVRVTVDVYARYRDNQRDFFPLLEYKLVQGD